MEYMQEQQNCSHKTWHICLEIVSNGISRISYVSLLRKKKSFHVLCFGINIFRLVGKNCSAKNEKCIVSPESQYVNSNLDIHMFLKLYG